MKIIIVGGTGTIGKAVVEALKPRHDVVTVGSKSGDVQVNIEDLSSIQAMYQQIGEFDALVSTTGKVTFAALTSMKPDSFEVGLRNKLMGQVNLVLEGLKHINDKGSFTLTSGILNVDPIRTSSSAGMINGGIDGFVVASSIEMPKSVRINAVSPTVLLESMDKYEAYFRGYEPVPAANVAQAYVKSVEGAQTGQVYRVGY